MIYVASTPIGSIYHSNYSLVISLVLSSDMDVSVDPCDDFFNYACGGWKKLNDIPDSEYAWNQITVLVLKNQKLISKLISDQKLKAKYKDVSIYSLQIAD